MVKGWIQEHWLREFVEALVRLVGVIPDDLASRPPVGSVWMDGGCLDEQCWTYLRELVERTGTMTRTWIGFSWTGRCEARCELQADDGYDGVFVRIEVPEEMVAGVEAAIQQAMRSWADPPKVPTPSPGVQPAIIRPPGRFPNLTSEQIKRLGSARRSQGDG